MADLTGTLMLRIEPSVRERLQAYADTHRELFGARLSLAAAARAAIDRGIEGLEADLAAARKAKRKR